MLGCTSTAAHALDSRGDAYIVTISFRFGNTVQVSAEGAIAEVNAAISKAIAEAVEASKQQPAAAAAAPAPAPADAPAAPADSASDEAADGGDGDALASTQVADGPVKPVPNAIHIDLAKALHEAWEQTEKGFEGSVKRCFDGLMSHFTRHTSHLTRHTSHVTRHTSHVTPVSSLFVSCRSWRAAPVSPMRR